MKKQAKKNVFYASIILLVTIVANIIVNYVINYNTTHLAKINEQLYLSEIKAKDLKLQEYRELYQQVLRIKNRYRTQIEEIIKLLYQKDMVAMGGLDSKNIPKTDEAIFLQLRNLTYSLNDDISLLENVKKYLNARKEFSESFPFIWPTKGGVPRVTSGFGFREGSAENDNKLHFHAGIDIAGHYGEDIIATAEGIVEYVDRNHYLYGKLIIVKHKYDFKTYYAHLSEIDVHIGEKIKRGDVIGKMGDTGKCNGVHLHYEIRHGDIPIDPMSFLTLNY